MGTLHMAASLPFAKGAVAAGQGRDALFGSMAFVGMLCSYFLMLPLREEAGLSLGTDSLPLLFVASLFLTALVSPTASWFLRRSSDCRRSMRDLYRCLSLAVICFFCAQLWLCSAEGRRSGAAGEREGARKSMHGRRLTADHKTPVPDPLTLAQATTQVALYLGISLINLLGTSVLWSRSVDVFSAEVGKATFGLLGAGATLGQLLGSLLAPRLLGLSAFLGRGGVSLTPLLGAALLLEGVAQCAGRYGQGPQLIRAAGEADCGGGGSSEPGGASRKRDGVWKDIKHGIALVRASTYLRYLCAYLVFNYFVSSFFYFEKMVVVAKAGDAVVRTTWFARIVSASALVIFLLQLCFTGLVLQTIGVKAALCVTPLTAAALMLAIAVRPTPLVVAAAEVLRKIVAYSVARPARELLFTVVTREEKYGVKILIDTLVPRLGDTAAAGAFRVLVPSLGLGPRALALFCLPACLLWAGVSWELGRRQERQSLAFDGAGKHAV